MSTIFPKHEWIRLMTRPFDDKRLTLEIRLLGVDMFTSSSVVDGTFTVHRQTVAARMGKSMKFVDHGYVVLASLGFIELVAAGKTGRPRSDEGNRRPAATWRLAFPVSTPQPVGRYDRKLPTRHDRNYPPATTETTHPPRPKLPTQNEPDLTSTSENTITEGLKEGLVGGLVGGLAAAAANTRPSALCKEHPSGAPGNCGACGEARRRGENWDRDAPIRAEAAAKARRAAIDACKRCDDFGQIDLDNYVKNCDHGKAA
jgi:hypothetical protein